MKRLTLLGSTGSIGENVLNVVRMHPGLFSIASVACGSNIDLLAEQIIEFKPDVAAVLNETYAKKLTGRLPGTIQTEIYHGPEGYLKAAEHSESDLVVSAIVGAAGLLPTLAAIDAGKDIALANKETLVMAGDLVKRRAAVKDVRIIPVDSEHSAIFQALQGNQRSDLKKILLTASGGPFRNRPLTDFIKITLEDALNHPTWNMGKKITIDSATLMNKGLEIIEAAFLFDVSVDDIEVLVHPQSIVHSMVSYVDGSVIAQLGVPDMKGAIAYAMTFPDRIDIHQDAPDFAALENLSFQKPDFEKFPCLSLAYKAAREGGTMPAVMNAANEIAVNAFLDRKITYMDISWIIKGTMDSHGNTDASVLDQILLADTEARNHARHMIEGMPSV